MFSFFTGNKKQDNKITNEFMNDIKNALTNQFCQFCKKQPATKVIFIPDGNRGFTCNNCELAAAGNDFRNLGEQTLITNEKLSETITKVLINYQTIQAQSPQQVKEIENQFKGHLKSSKETIEAIKGEVKLLKMTCENKLNEFIKSSETQNSNVLFEELNKKAKQKRSQSEELIQLVTKKALVNRKGLHFIDEEAIQKSNKELDQRVNNLQSDLKIKLKNIDFLVNQIDAIQF